MYMYISTYIHTHTYMCKWFQFSVISHLRNWNSNKNTASKTSRPLFRSILT